MMHRFPSIISPRLLAIAAVGASLLGGLAAAAAPEVAPEKLAEKTPEKPIDSAKPIKQSANGLMVLSARNANIHGTRLRYEPEKDTLGYWFNADDWVSWEFEITRPGKLFVDLNQSCAPESAGSHYTVEVAGQKFRDKMQSTGSFRQFRRRRLGTLQIDKPGIYTLSLRVQDKPRLAVMDLRDITLLPPALEKPVVLPAIPKPPAKSPPGKSPSAPSAESAAPKQ